jgi:hypothetical protein
VTQRDGRDLPRVDEMFQVRLRLFRIVGGLPKLQE